MTAAESNPPEQFKPKAKKPKAVKAVEDSQPVVYEYQPKDGSAVIQLPLAWEMPDMSKAEDRQWLWALDDVRFDLQIKRWLDRAGVDRAVRQRIAALDPAEWSVMLESWFKVSQEGITPGE